MINAFSQSYTTFGNQHHPVKLALQFLTSEQPSKMTPKTQMVFLAYTLFSNNLLKKHSLMGVIW
jgi:hypothetical protein